MTLCPYYCPYDMGAMFSFPSRLSFYQIPCASHSTLYFTRLTWLGFETIPDYLQIQQQSFDNHALWTKIRIAAPQQLSRPGEIPQKGPRIPLREESGLQMQARKGPRKPLREESRLQMQASSKRGEPFEIPLPPP